MVVPPTPTSPLGPKAPAHSPLLYLECNYNIGPIQSIYGDVHEVYLYRVSMVVYLKCTCSQGCINRGTCSHPELTQDQVLTSAYVIRFANKLIQDKSHTLSLRSVGARGQGQLGPVEGPKKICTNLITTYKIIPLDSSY